MKFFVVFALCVAAVTANVISPIVVADEAAEIQQILDAIHHPSTDPATAAALEQLLNEILGITKPEEIDAGPAIIEGDYESISVGPAIVDEAGPVPEITNSPLVQIIINVKPGSGNPVVVEGLPEVAPSPVIVEEKPVVVEKPEIVPSPVIVVEKPEAPEPVIVAPVVIPEPVIVAPVVIPEPVITLPDILN